MVEIDQDKGATILNHKFFTKLCEKYEQKKYCEEIQFLKEFGGVCNILKTLESGINQGINMLYAEERLTSFG